MQSINKVINEHLDKKVRISYAIFLITIITMFVIVIADSFKYKLPFYYVLFVLSGLLISYGLKRADKIQWNNQDRKITRGWDIAGIIILIWITGMRYFFLPDFLKEIHVIFISDAIMLIFIGIYLGRLIHMRSTVNEIVFSLFYEKNGVDESEERMKEQIQAKQPAKSLKISKNFKRR